MPVHFRELPADQITSPLYGDVFFITVNHTTEMEAFARFVPSVFEILEPVVNVQYKDCRDVEWISGGNYRILHSVIPGTVATPIFTGAKVPEGALKPEDSARTILERIRDNMRIVFVDPDDMEGAKNCNHPDLQPSIDEYFNRIATARKAGDTSAL